MDLGAAFLGCTGHASETAALFGDEIGLRAGSLRAGSANPPTSCAILEL